MSRYLIKEHLGSILRIDRETPCFWVTTVQGRRGQYDSRQKKQHGDMLFDTFAGAKRFLTTALERRLSMAHFFDEQDLEEDDRVWITDVRNDRVLAVECGATIHGVSEVGS